jgi:hypothetical protein
MCWSSSHLGGSLKRPSFQEDSNDPDTISSFYQSRNADPNVRISLLSGKNLDLVFESHIFWWQDLAQQYVSFACCFD